MNSSQENHVVVTGGSAERWYLRIDGRDYGPVSRKEMEKFLLPPRLCSVMEIKCGDEGTWFAVAKHETIDKVYEVTGIPVELAPVAPANRPATSARLEYLRDIAEGGVSWVLRYRIPITALLLLVGGSLAFLFLFENERTREREILTAYETIWQQVAQFDPETTSADDWKKFAGPAQGDLETLLKELQRTANVDRPVRQNLLFAGRDHLLRILKDEAPPVPNAPQALLFEKRLELARQKMAPANPSKK